MKLSIYQSNSVSLAPLEINSTLYVENKSGMQPDFHLFHAYICSFFYYSINYQYLAETHE